MFRFLTIFTISSLFVFSCTKDEVADLTPQAETIYLSDDTTDPQDFSPVGVREITEEEVSTTLNSPVAPFESVELITEKGLDGITREYYLVNGDGTMSVEAYKIFQQAMETGEKQYYSSSIVYQSSNTINIVGYNGNNSNGLRAATQTGLRWAVDNYNRLDTRFNFNLTFTTDWGSADIVVYRYPLSTAGGSADFPEAGKPGRFVRIYSGADNFNNQAQEHLTCHEIGHAMGLRHTDWRTQASCLSPNPEVSGSNGANFISTTPEDDELSIMSACFNQDITQGEFSFYDKVALEYLY